MPVVIGILLAVAVGLFGRVVGMDRDRSFYATVLVVVGSYYLLFAAIGHDGLVPEALVFAGFAGMAVLGFRGNAWWLVAGLALHGLFDFVRPDILTGNGVPGWWPTFCLGFDVAAAAILMLILAQERNTACLNRPGPDEFSENEGAVLQPSPHAIVASRLFDPVGFAFPTEKTGSVRPN